MDAAAIHVNITLLQQQAVQGHLGMLGETL